MSRVRGRSFKITKNQANGYGYARPGMRKNPGVTTIAAINGRGAYAGRSARSAMSGLRQNARVGHARRRLTAAEKKAFKARMARGRNMSANRSTTSTQRATSRRNIRKAQTARKAWGRKLPRGKRVRVGSASYGRKPKARRLKAGVYVANRRKKAGSTVMAKRRRKRASTATKKRRRSSKRRRKTSLRTAAPKRRRRRKSRKGAARKRTTARKTVRRRRRRKAATKLTANRRRRHRRNAKSAPKRRRRRSRRAVAAAPKRRRSRRRRSRKGTARRTTRKRRVSRRRRTGGRKLKANRRRRHRRNPQLASNRRRRSHRRKGHKANRRRRSHRRNGRKLFKMNGVGDVLKFSAVVFGGFAAHRLLTNLFSNQVLARLLPAPVVPAATSGSDLSGQRGLIASLIVGAGGSFLASKAIKNPETRKLVIAGMVASTIHSAVVSLLRAFAPAGADMLAGPEDGTASSLGAGASIMPRYGVINGMGEYFREPMNGLGEYFREPMNGLGEYIAASSGTSGLGTYEANGDLYQAAAGFGAQDYQGNHIDPSGDLDRQLTIAEAAAGVGALSPFEAAAGIGPMQAAAGFGAIDTVPSGDTWIPGSVNPQLWAGARAISNGQSATEMTPAGSLATDGGQGIFG